MSGYALIGGLTTDDPTRLTGNTATTVFTAVGATPIASIIVCPTTGTPTFTITLVSPAAVIRNIWKGTSPNVFNEYIMVPPLYVLKVTSSSATGDMDVTVTHGTPAAANQR